MQNILLHDNRTHDEMTLIRTPHTRSHTEYFTRPLSRSVCCTTTKAIHVTRMNLLIFPESCALEFFIFALHEFPFGLGGYQFCGV